MGQRSSSIATTAVKVTQWRFGMRKEFIGRRASIAIVLTIFVIACGKSSGTNAPAAPSGSASPLPAGAVASGATISGMVASGAGTASVRTLGATMTVAIMGTSIAAAVDTSGGFTLQNVPAGD